jgi:hypothetical protein
MTSYRAYHPHNCFRILSAILEMNPNGQYRGKQWGGQVQKLHTLHNILMQNFYSNDKHLPYLRNNDTENNLGISYATIL